MPHLKCVTCRTRYYTPGDPTDPISDLCPSCGCAFVPVGELSELVGFRAITARDGSAAGTSSQGFVDRLGDLLERRARDAQAQRDA
jgi:hypothetical protein